MPRYSEERKAAVLKKLLPPQNPIQVKKTVWLDQMQLAGGCNNQTVFPVAKGCPPLSA